MRGGKSRRAYFIFKGDFLLEHTEYYHLSLWEQDDRIQMEDFNSDNAKIDAALKAATDAAAAAAAGSAKVAWGSYVGNGNSGNKENATSITLSFEPKLLVVTGGGVLNGNNTNVTMFAVRGSASTIFLAKNAELYDANSFWEGNTVSWYTIYSAKNQMNESGTTYYYVAIG